MDQAEGLRRGAARNPATAGLPVPALPALAVTGGKGGVGKTCVAVNLAVALARAGMKPLLVDLDLGLANADVLLGVDPQHTLHDVVFGGKSLESVVTPTPWQVDFIPAASGHEELTRLSERQLADLFAGIGRLAAGHDHDLVILDTPAGIGREVMWALRSARTILVVVTPDPTSLTDAYALIKVFESQAPGRDIRVLVNQANNLGEAQAVHNRLAGVARTHLKRDLVFVGFLPRDPALTEAVRRRKPLAAGAIDGPAMTAFKGLAARFKGERWKT